MKLTKGKLAKLLNKKKQSMKKNKKGKREKRGRQKTFRNRKHLNLMKKTLKKWSGGDDVVPVEKIVEKKTEKEEFIVQQDDSNIDPTSFLNTSKERENEIDESKDVSKDESKDESKDVSKDNQADPENTSVEKNDENKIDESKNKELREIGNKNETRTRKAPRE
jgi:hypothetical protein